MRQVIVSVVATLKADSVTPVDQVAANYILAVLATVAIRCFIAISRQIELVFTARCYASAVLTMALCPSVCLSITSRCSTKTAKCRITQITPHDSPGTLVF